MTKNLKNKNKNKNKLPDKILKIINLDKEGWHESWSSGRNMLNIIHPFRIVIAGKPNCGKSTTCKNILLRCKPRFKRIIVVHCDDEGTKEYDDLDAELLGEVPDPKDQELFDGKTKTLLIFDDIEYEFLPKIQKRNLDRCFGYLSTHKCVSILLACQNITSVCPAVRRMSNFFILFKVPDMDLLFLIARKCGIKKEIFKEIFEKRIVGYHDSFWIDLTINSPFPWRINGYTALDLKNI